MVRFTCSWQEAHYRTAVNAFGESKTCVLSYIRKRKECMKNVVSIFYGPLCIFLFVIETHTEKHYLENMTKMPKNSQRLWKQNCFHSDGGDRETEVILTTDSEICNCWSRAALPTTPDRHRQHCNLLDQTATSPQSRTWSTSSHP